MGGGGITIDIEVIRADDVLAPAKFHRRLCDRTGPDIVSRSAPGRASSRP